MKQLFKRAKIKTLLFIFISLFFNSHLCNSEITIKKDGNIIEHINNLLELTTEYENNSQDVPILKYTNKITQKQKPWTLMIYIAADNDLRNFAIRNLKQMAKIGSNQYINIVVHLDIKLVGNKKVTKRYYIEKDRILHLNANDPKTQRMDSGNPKTLISFCDWAVTEFPAQNYGLILWNHGTGAIDPARGRIFKLSELFTFNPQINKIEVDRSIGFFDLLNAYQLENRAICFDDSTNNHLTNQDLNYALNKIHTKTLKGKKLAFIGFDACLMQMIEVANTVKKYAKTMIASQEVILGFGWDYIETLKPFQKRALTRDEFSKHIVSTYKKTYERITNDFTLSAIKLQEFDLIEENINHISSLLIQCLKKQKNKSVKRTISTCRSRLLCTHFDEPSFIDIHHFYTNILASLKNFALYNKKEETKLKQELKKALTIGCKIIENITIANVVGKNLPKAKGLSIYFPTSRIYFSYRKLDFCKNNNWIAFLTQYLNV